jgi:hypothetical protein
MYFSMFRFNEHDGRLDRTLQSALLLMLSCLNPSTTSILRQKLILEIWSHSGDGPLRYWCSFPSRKENQTKNEYFPGNQTDAVKIIEAMYGSCLQCVAGDNSLTALELSIKKAQDESTLLQHNLDETFVIVTSDALLGQYGIRASDISRIMKSSTRSPHNTAGPGSATSIKPIMIFMGSFGDEAEDLKHQLPVDSCYLCLGKSGQELSVIIKSILISGSLNKRNSYE